MASITAIGLSTLKAAGVTHVGTHGIRHRSATDIANSGISVKVGMALTAHKTVAMFMRYVHTEDKSVREAAELVANRRKAITRGGDSMSRRRVANASPATPKVLLGDIRALIEASRKRVASSVNAKLTLLFWQIGQRVHTEVLAGQRAWYREEILPTLAEQLTRDYGRSFGEKNLRRMLKFAATFPEEPVVAALSRQLSWSHFVLLLALKEPLQRDYYAQMASAERWSWRPCAMRSA